MAAATNKANQRQSKRRKPRYDAYRNQGRSEKAQAKRLIKHLALFPADAIALAALASINMMHRPTKELPKLGMSARQHRAQRGVTLTQLKRHRRTTHARAA